jgi:hypothetical protein
MKKLLLFGSLFLCLGTLSACGGSNKGDASTGEKTASIEETKDVEAQDIKVNTPKSLFIDNKKRSIWILEDYSDGIGKNTRINGFYVFENGEVTKYRYAWIDKHDIPGNLSKKEVDYLNDVMHQEVNVYYPKNFHEKVDEVTKKWGEEHPVITAGEYSKMTDDEFLSRAEGSYLKSNPVKVKLSMFTDKTGNSLDSEIMTSDEWTINSYHDITDGDWWGSPNPIIQGNGYNDSLHWTFFKAGGRGGDMSYDVYESKFVAIGTSDDYKTVAVTRIKEDNPWEWGDFQLDELGTKGIPVDE